MPRRHNLERALGTSRRSIWIATGLILLIGVALLLWLFSPAEQSRREQVERLQVGDHMGRVAGVLGPPGARCPVGDMTRYADSFPPGWTAAAIETTLQALEEETDERWVYGLGEDEPVTCDPAPGRTEIGLDRGGRVLWYVSISGESPIEVGPRFTPAPAEPE